MSDQAARAALSRMNMREIALAPHYSGAALANDLHHMAGTSPDEGQKAFLERRGELCAAYGFAPTEQKKPFAYSNGLAIIPISGSLINRFGQSYGYVTGYNFIRSQLNLALLDDDVKGIVFDVNSFGGEAAGCFELSAEIKASRAIKPTLAVVDSNAYSAGYALASAASKLVVIPSAGVGSIGVIAMHVDMSKMLSDWGLAVTLIYEGEHKADGNPFEPLPEGVKKAYQKSIHESYEGFCALVAANRGIDIQVVRDTQSRTYRAEEAKSLGLIDAIASPSQAVQAFFGELSGSTHQLQKEDDMSTQATSTPGAQEKAPDNTATNQAAIEKASSDARVAERTRITGITGSDEAKGRSTLANHLAMNTDMSVESAKAVLAASPQEAAAAAPAAATNPFKQAMDNSNNPNVGADTSVGGAGGDNSASAAASAILSAQYAATGYKAPKD